MDIQDAIFLVKKREPLFTALLIQLKPTESDKSPTLGTDGRNLYYNQSFLDSLTIDEAAGVVLHEVLHCAFQHLWRRKERDRFRWNIATDYAINTIVNETFPLPKGSLLDIKYKGMSAEKIYELLPKQNPMGEHTHSEDGKADGEQEWCEHDKWEKKKGKKGKGLKGKIRDIFGQEEMGEDEDSAEEMWKRLFEKNMLRQYGKLPASMKRVIEDTYYVPTIDWNTLVSRLLSEDITDYSFSVPDRRYLENDFMLPDMSSLDKLKDIVFAYDTSGSITQEDLTSYYIETLNLFNNFSSLQGWVAVCDAALHSFKDISPQMLFDQFDFVGGGGTDFNPVFEEIKRKEIRPKALFYFTDCDGSYPEEDPGYPVFWLVRGSYSAWREVPFGTVISFVDKS